MNADERLMFHLTQGALRRWSLWNEPSFPDFAVGEEAKYQLFQSWKANPATPLDPDPVTGEPRWRYHPMATFENWPLWLVLDLYRTVFRDTVEPPQITEPEQLQSDICDVLDERYSLHEKTGPSHLLG